ncbi:porin [Sedimenticola sp.]|uniref:porin n=1 Tax=Sedimenticola sp. TaxID=1940285 RepID=UPI00258E48BF|nr:porin [Sedimenticola sp.]MCW8904640.1 porin [Sedimenticola sp.]
MKLSKLVVAMLGGVCVAGAGSAQAIEWEAGDWTLGLGGNINAFYTVTSCDAGDLNSGGTTLAGLACGTAGNSHSVSNGLLPASLNFSAKTHQEGYDIGANINVYYGLTSQGGAGSDALAFSTVDARQVYLTFGNTNMGTITMGRNFGLFALDAILNDISLVGAGPSFSASDPGHTTLGGLGYGYPYTDRLAQINWTLPTSGGLSATIGVFNPLDGVEAGGGKAAGHGSPGFHGKVGYSWQGSTPGMISATYLMQDVDLTTGASSQIEGWDIFGKVSLNNFDLAGYYFQGDGMSTLALGGLVFPGFNEATGQAEESNGYYLQGAYNFGKTKLGVNWGESEQKKVSPVENTRVTLGVYHNLTSSLTLMAEYSDMESKTAIGSDDTSAVNLGAILFF